MLEAGVALLYGNQAPFWSPGGIYLNVNTVTETEAGVDPAGNNLAARGRLLALSAGVLVAIVGGGHLGAWLAGAMAQYGSSTITMKANAALGLFLAGTALVLIVFTRPGKGFLRRAAQCCALLVLGIGAFTLLEHVVGWNLGIDQLLATEPAGALATSSPNRLGPPAALCFTLSGTALLVMAAGRGAQMAQGIAICVCVLSLLGVIGHFYEVRGLYALAQLTAIAWPTAVAFLLLGIGTLCVRPQQGLMRLVTADDPGGVALRWLALPSILVLILLGWLRLWGERHGLYETALGTGLLVLVFSILFCGLVYATARALSRMAASQRDTQRVLQRQARLIDLTPAATIVRDVDGTVRFWNLGAVRLYGWSRDEALGRRTDDLLRTVLPEPLEEVVAHIRKEGHWSGELRQQTKDGRTLLVKSWWVAKFGADKSVVELLESNLDITDRTRAEEALKESEERYRSFVEASAQVVWRTNNEGKVDQSIPSWNAFTGQTDSEAYGFGWMSAIHSSDRSRVTEAWRAASAARALYQVEYRLKRHDGEWRHILARGVPVLERDGSVREYIGTCIDVTEQRQAEAAVQKQARLIDLAPAATMVRGLDGTISFWSDGAEKFYVWPAREALGSKSHELLCTQFPQPLHAILQHLRQQGRWSGELRHRTRDGREVTVESHWLGQFTPAGDLLEVMESNMDITERKHAEDDLRRLKEELEVRVSERTSQLASANKEMEAFSYSVSHDLRAPLRHVTSYLSMLQRSIGPRLDPNEERYLRIVMDASRRMGGLIDDLLALSRLGRATMEIRTVDLRNLVKEVLGELAPAMAGRAIEWEVGELPSVQADLNLLRSAFTNLIGNAIKYTRERNPAVIEIGSRRAEGELVCFVRDNGAGFDMKFKDKLFGAFQRLHTSQEFEGTGIGLASVRRVVERHGGRTWAEGEPGKGATFYFSIPLEKAVRADTIHA